MATKFSEFFQKAACSILYLTSSPQFVSNNMNFAYHYFKKQVVILRKQNGNLGDLWMPPPLNTQCNVFQEL